MPDFPALGYGIVTGRFLAGTLDDDVFPAPTPPAQGTLAPDAEPLSGSVVFSATAPVILVAGSTPPSTFFPVPLRVYLDDEGYLSRGDSREIALWATDDQDGNPYDWQWHVHFDLNLNGHGVYRAPFNFELPEGETIDLAIVAPVTSPSDGTIIIRGPVGPPGPGVTDLITAKGDMVAGTGPEAAAIIHVGAEGEYLTPDPAAETGLAWKPLPEGVKAYANLAEAEAVRTSEVGTLWVPSMNAAFYNLSTQWDTFKVAGAAELVITTTVTDSLAVIGTKKYVLQEFHVRAAATEHQRVMRVVRVFEFDTQSGATTPPTPLWEVLPDLPGSGYGGDGVAVTDPFGKWWAVAGYPDSILSGDTNGNWRTAPSGSTPQPYSVVKRDPESRAQIADPADPLDIANKGYVDGAIGAIPPAPPEPPASETVAGIARYSTQGEVDAGTDLASTVRPGTLAPYVASQIAAAPVAPHTHPEIGGTHRFLFDATPAGDPGTGRLSVENVGGQSRLLRVSKTDADGGTVNLAPLAIGDSAILSGEGATPTIFARGFAITVVTDAVTHWEFTVQRESGVGALPADATPLLLNVTLANGAGSSTGLPTPDALDQMIISVPGVAPTPFDWGKVQATHVIGGPGDVLGTIMRRNSTDATVEVGDPARIHDAVNLQSMDRAIAALPVAIPAWAPNTKPFLALPADTLYTTTPDTPGLILVDGGGNIQFQELGKSYIVRHTGVTPNPTNFTAYSNNGRGPGKITPGQSILVYTGTDPIPVTNFTLLDGAVFRANPGIPDSNAQVITNADSGKLYSTGAGIWNVSLVNPGPVALNSPIVLWPLNGCVLTITPDTTAIGPRVITGSEGPVRIDWDYNTWVIEPMGKMNADKVVTRPELRIGGVMTIGAEHAGYALWGNAPTDVTLVNPSTVTLASPIYLQIQGGNPLTFAGNIIAGPTQFPAGGMVMLDYTYNGWVITPLGAGARPEIRVQSDRTIGGLDNGAIFWGNDNATYTLTLGAVDFSLDQPIMLAPFTNAVFNLVGVTHGPTQVSAATGPVRLDYFYGVGWVAELLVTPPTWGRWSGTQAAYDAIAVKDPNTLYVVV